MSEQNDRDLERTQQLYDFLQGKLPESCTVPRKERPKLTPDQAWTVIWYLGNQYWQVTDCVERCGVCGRLYHTEQEGGYLDYGKPPYGFCEDCLESEAYAKKSRSRLNPDRKRMKDEG